MTSESHLANEILAVAERRAMALIQRDLALINSLLSPDFVYTNAIGEAFDKESYIQRYVLNPDVTWISQEIIENQIIFLAGSAILVARIHDIARFGDHALDAEFRTTQIYRSTQNGWQYVVGHTSNIASERA